MYVLSNFDTFRAAVWLATLLAFIFTAVAMFTPAWIYDDFWDPGVTHYFGLFGSCSTCRHDGNFQDCMDMWYQTCIDAKNSPATSATLALFCIAWVLQFVQLLALGYVLVTKREPLNFPKITLVLSYVFFSALMIAMIVYSIYRFDSIGYSYVLGWVATVISMIVAAMQSRLVCRCDMRLTSQVTARTTTAHVITGHVTTARVITIHQADADSCCSHT